MHREQTLASEQKALYDGQKALEFKQRSVVSKEYAVDAKERTVISREQDVKTQTNNQLTTALESLGLATECIEGLAGRDHLTAWQTRIEKAQQAADVRQHDLDLIQAEFDKKQSEAKDLLQQYGSFKAAGNALNKAHQEEIDALNAKLAGLNAAIQHQENSRQSLLDYLIQL